MSAQIFWRISEMSAQILWRIPGKILRLQKILDFSEKILKKNWDFSGKISKDFWKIPNFFLKNPIFFLTFTHSVANFPTILFHTSLNSDEPKFWFIFVSIVLICRALFFVVINYILDIQVTLLVIALTGIKLSAGFQIFLEIWPNIPPNHSQKRPKHRETTNHQEVYRAFVSNYWNWQTLHKTASSWRCIHLLKDAWGCTPRHQDARLFMMMHPWRCISMKISASRKPPSPKPPSRKPPGTHGRLRRYQRGACQEVYRASVSKDWIGQILHETRILLKMHISSRRCAEMRASSQRCTPLHEDARVFMMHTSS